MTREEVLKIIAKARKKGKRADLGGADLSGADLSGADLSRADLGNIKLSWNSHDLIAELLLRAAEEDVAKRQVAGLVLISRDWCWKDFLELRHPQRKWALGVLKPYLDDSAFEILIKAIKQAKV